ncbi:uncharacterized protein LOC128922791 isoform X2 [Zeugodacus cucurbitae]|uniref:uncharacterized protein LOC128922791 isoform X2 n=1 Tax=Zeugodacus cucurbitae TaxID=28588 RepID=UPI0023D95E6F|nr:uncharacterized protein LOC128922791 isoform X2 [Zeugodacus cucurbitae]
MFLNLIKRTFKKYLTTFKIRLYALKFTSVLINIYCLQYDGEHVIVKNSRINRYKRKTRKICMLAVFLHILLSFVGCSCIKAFQLYYPKVYLQIDDLVYLCKLYMATNATKSVITFCMMLCWWNKRNQKTLITLLNELLVICRKLNMRLDIDFNKLPPQSSLLFQLQFLLIIWNLLNNVRRVFSFDNIVHIMKNVYITSFYLIYQTVLLTLWQLHYKANVKFAMRMERETFKYKTVLKFITFLRNLKNFQHRFAKAFVWLPRLVTLKTFLIVGQSSYLWQNQHQTLADVKLIWLYTNLVESLLDMFLLVFMLSELCRLDHYTQRLLFEADNILHSKAPARSGSLKELEAYLSTPRFNSYTLQLHPFVQQISHFQIWAILIPVACGFIMNCLNPFDMLFIRDLRQFN